MKTGHFMSALATVAISTLACNLQAAGLTPTATSGQFLATDTITPTSTSTPPTEATSTSTALTATPTLTLVPSITNTQPAALPDWPLVRQGDSGAVVSALQYLLRFQGQNLDVDGNFGPKTRAAVTDFQTSKGLGADGIVGPQTWTKLIQGAQVKKGSHSDAVRAAQYLLSSKFKYGMVVDGIFGPQTETAVKAFQESTHLTADGIIGPQTWQTLIGL